jgi:hypothetical protein
MNNALVIILFDHPREHTSDYAHQTARFFRKQNIVIGVLCKDAKSLWELLRERKKFRIWETQNRNYYIYRPLYVIPLRRYAVIQKLNIFLNSIIVRLISFVFCRTRAISKTYLWIFNPENYPVMKLFGSSVVSVYDCVDYHGHEPEHKNEHLLIRQCAHVFVNSRVLFDSIYLHRHDVRQVPLGFDLPMFKSRHPASPTRLPHTQPVIGYIGGINSRLDYPLLSELAGKNPQLNFVFVGPIQRHEEDGAFEAFVKPKIDALLSYPNVYHVLHVSKDTIPGIIRQFDIGMIPYDTSKQFNKFCYPMKFLEYCYTGKPVLSTPIDELKQFPKFVKTGRTAKEWEKNITEILSKPWSSGFQKEQRRIAEANSWENKFSGISMVITRAALS